jgi:hypothetical protein
MTEYTSRIQLTPLLDLLIIIIFALLASSEAQRGAEMEDIHAATAELEDCLLTAASTDELNASLVTKENEAAILREKVQLLQHELDERTAQLRQTESQLEEDRRQATAEAQALATLLSEKLGTEVGKAAVERTAQTMSASDRQEFKRLLEKLDASDSTAVVAAIRDSAIVAARVNLLRVHLRDDGHLRFLLESSQADQDKWLSSTELSSDYPMGKHVRDYLNTKTDFPDRPLWIILQTYGPGASNELRRGFLNSDSKIRSAVFSKLGGGKSLVIAGGGLSLNEEETK